MAKLTCISSKGFLTEWKPRIYYTGHPTDCPRYFSEIREAVTACCPCDLYYDQEPEAPLTDDQRAEQLCNMNLLIVPVTMALLSRPNPAMNGDIPFARRLHIPILPILVVPGIVSACTLPHKFGSTPYVDMANRQERHLTFREELGEQLQRLLPEQAMILLAETLLSSKDPSQEPLPNGIASLFGIGRDINGRLAENCLVRAANEGSAAALEFLYKMHDRGIGVPQNLPCAMIWATKLSAHYRKEENIPHWTTRLQYLSQLSDSFRRMGDTAYAARLAGDLTALSRDTLGSGHAYTQRCIRLEADLAQETTDLQRLLLLRRQLQRRSRQELGQTDPTTLADLLRLARGHELTGNTKEATRRLEELQEFSIRAEDPAMVATALYRLACIHNSKSQFAEALALVERCIDLRRAALGSGHPDTLQAVSMRAGLLSPERPTEALNLRRLLHNRYRRALGPLHPLTLDALTLLAVRLHSMGRYAESLKHIERAYQAYERFYGPDFVRTKMAKSMYERIKKATEESE